MESNMERPVFHVTTFLVIYDSGPSASTLMQRLVRVHDVWAFGKSIQSTKEVMPDQAGGDTTFLAIMMRVEYINFWKFPRRHVILGVNPLVYPCALLGIKYIRQSSDWCESSITFFLPVRIKNCLFKLTIILGAERPQVYSVVTCCTLWTRGGSHTSCLAQSCCKLLVHPRIIPSPWFCIASRALDFRLLRLTVVPATQSITNLIRRGQSLFRIGTDEPTSLQATLLLQGSSRLTSASVLLFHQFSRYDTQALNPCICMCEPLQGISPVVSVMSFLVQYLNYLRRYDEIKN